MSADFTIQCSGSTEMFGPFPFVVVRVRIIVNDVFSIYSTKRIGLEKKSLIGNLSQRNDRF